ncbi:hypothetical protein [Homoserinibacter sp. GY 40078]|uniref:hypothetical protein n=1 Tax=Homoserinibacter sp. GY 40078 TaxID=2603275 RepID=UPI0011CBA32F|nr:hypothetical protein [Homoserinibacter sp. GY 40078]TXK19406.1 hypothetical protein FVQ89_05765 [Homoserinibacter sp. GY 40078]
MDLSGAGTGIMVALAAVLWFLYLLPSWVRRREYLATERNATRLQRAMRVLAEAAEVPDEVRVEVSAREALRREKLLRAERRRRDAEERAELRAATIRAREAEIEAARVEAAARADAARVAAAEARAAEARAIAEPRREVSRPAVPVVGPLRPVASRAPLNRARRLAGLLLLAALVTAVVQVWLIATTGAVAGSWLVLAGCAAAGVASLSLQRAIIARARARVLAVAQPVRRRTSSTLLDAEPLPAPVEREWTPVPIPKPLYLERNDPPRVPVAPAVSAEELLAAAAAEAERALAAAHAEPEVVRFPARPAAAPAPAAAPVAPAAQSRFAQMGVVGDVEQQLDLDEVLRRRRLG